jgi:hypothetical protein
MKAALPLLLGLAGLATLAGISAAARGIELEGNVVFGLALVVALALTGVGAIVALVAAVVWAASKRTG